MMGFVLSTAVGLLASADQPAAARGIPARPRSGAFTQWDYPAAAVHAVENGRTQIYLDISAEGSITDCRVTGSSGSPSLDATSCMVPLHRFRFTPGRNERGERVPSGYMQTITWVLPTHLPDPPDMASWLPNFALGEVRHTLAMNRRGMACALEKSGEAFAAEAATGYCQAGRHDPAVLARQPIAMMIVTRIVPEGATPQPRRPIAGTFIAGATSDIEVAGDGSIVSCQEVPLTEQGRQPFVPLCLTRLRPRVAFQPDPQGRTQRGRYSIELYRLRSPAR